MPIANKKAVPACDRNGFLQVNQLIGLASIVPESPDSPVWRCPA
jgi:hypothetical protein